MSQLKTVNLFQDIIYLIIYKGRHKKKLLMNNKKQKTLNHILSLSQLPRVTFLRQIFLYLHTSSSFSSGNRTVAAFSFTEKYILSAQSKWSVKTAKLAINSKIM